VPKVTSSLYPEYIANLKLPVDVFYWEIRSHVIVAKRNITTGLFGLWYNWNIVESGIKHHNPFTLCVSDRSANI
jgi:hypothetical protein